MSKKKSHTFASEDEASSNYTKWDESEHMSHDADDLMMREAEVDIFEGFKNDSSTGKISLFDQVFKY